MQRIFNELVARECTMCHEMLQGNYYTYVKRKTKTQVIYYQRADCRFCRAKKEKQRRDANKTNPK
jgi:hypothetical protein